MVKVMIKQEWFIQDTINRKILAQIQISAEKPEFYMRILIEALKAKGLRVRLQR